MKNPILFLLVMFPCIAQAEFTGYTGYYSGAEGSSKCEEIFSRSEQSIAEEARLARDDEANGRRVCNGKFFGVSECHQRVDREQDQGRRNRQAWLSTLNHCKEPFKSESFKVAIPFVNYCADLFKHAREIPGKSYVDRLVGCMTEFNGKKASIEAAALCNRIEWWSAKQSTEGWQNKLGCYSELVDSDFDKVLIGLCRGVKDELLSSCLSMIKNKKSSDFAANAILNCEKKRDSERVSCLGLLRESNTVAARERPDGGSCAEELTRTRDENRTLLRLLERVPGLMAQGNGQKREIEQLTRAIGTSNETADAR